MADDVPPQRYNAALANEIERKWQDRWDDQHVFYTPNRTGLLSEDPRHLADRPHLFVLDMFPYPSGVGLHVGHPLGFIATDVYARFQRMNGFNVLHTMGYDAFGLPAEQYAVQTGTHPRITTEQNIANMKRQLRALGLGHDPRRGPATTDVQYYRWTQWIFLQIYNVLVRRRSRTAPARSRSWCRSSGRAVSPTPDDVPFDELGPLEQRRLVDSYRLAYEAYAPVNWCPGLGTVLANEEVTADGRSERGNFPVYRRPLKQWMLRITAYADRLLDDLDLLDWTDSIKLMQRNWIGRSTGASVRFPVEGHEDLDIEVFTTRPDTLFGATYMVLAPEHPLVDVITAEPVARRRARATTSRATRSTRGRGCSAPPTRRPTRSRATASSRPRRPISSGRPRRRRRPACSSARSRSTPRTTSASRSSSPTTCSWATAPARSWPCPRTTSATSSSPASSSCRSSR